MPIFFAFHKKHYFVGTADALVEKPHKVCPYSNATRGNVDVRLHVAV